MIRVLAYITATAVALLCMPRIVPGIEVADLRTAFVVALLWGLVSVLVRPVLALLTLPINLLTLGLFSFVLNAGLFLGLSLLVGGFSVGGFIPALEATVVLTITSWVVHAIFA